MAENPADILIADLIKIASAYAFGHGMTLEAVGRKFYGNSRFFPALRAKKRRSLSVDKLFKMIGDMRADWPEKTDWPPTRAILIEGPGA
jgi:hypothetical protein